MPDDAPGPWWKSRSVLQVGALAGFLSAGGGIFAFGSGLVDWMRQEKAVQAQETADMAIQQCKELAAIVDEIHPPQRLNVPAITNVGRALNSGDPIPTPTGSDE